MRYAGLNILYYPFREKVLAGLEEVNRAGIPLDVFETFRSRGRQSKLWAKGRTEPGPKVTWVRPGHSHHNYGLAVDLVLKVGGRWTWEHLDLYRKAGPYLELQGLKWLGRTTGDLVHYEYKSPYTVSDLQAFYDAGGLEEVWTRLDML